MITRPVRILMIIDHLGTGGAQEFIVSLCQHLKRDSVQITVCALRSGGVYEQKLNAMGIRVYTLPPSRSLIHVPFTIWKLYRLIRSERFDVIHTYLQGSFIIATPMSWLMRIPTIHSIMSLRAQIQKWFFPLMTWYQRWVTLYLTPFPSELLEAHISPPRIKQVEVTLDIDDMLTVSHDAEKPIEPFDLVGKYPLVLSIGRLHPDKGHEYAIRAWPKVVEHWPQARLVIVGNGEDEARLRSVAQETGYTDSIIFAGFRTDLVSLFSRADILLRTSVNEGINLTTIQGMAAGVPIIGFHNNAPKEIIHHMVNGLLIQLRDVSALADAINTLAEDTSLRRMISHQGRYLVIKYFDMERVADFYESLYLAIYAKQPLNGLADMADDIRTFDTHFSKMPSLDA